MSISPNNTMVVVMAVTADQYAVCVCLAGDIDLASEPDLASLVDNLAETHCRLVHIDLHEVTFGGSSLINFLFRLADRLPGRTAMTLCRPSATTLELIELTGLRKVATVHHNLPADWTAPLAPTGKPLATHTVALA